MTTSPTPALLREIRGCTHCADCLPLGPRPIISFVPTSRIVLLSQAPGSIAHQKDLAWMDPSGHRLREWLGASEETFYDPRNFAILPMGFCYPGKGKSGDLPPRPECAPLWHDRVWAELKEVKLTILIGAYAQRAYLGKRSRKTLTETVRNYQDYLPEFFPLPHPSPRNRVWMGRNPWFDGEVVVELRKVVKRVIDG